MYTRLSTEVGGGTHCPPMGYLELAAGLVFSSMLHRMSEQRSETHFYTLIWSPPCQSYPCWHWNGFSSCLRLKTRSQKAPSLQVASICKYLKTSSEQAVTILCLLVKRIITVFSSCVWVNTGLLSPHTARSVFVLTGLLHAQLGTEQICGPIYVANKTAHGGKGNIGTIKYESGPKICFVRKENNKKFHLRRSRKPLGYQKNN